MTSNRLCIYIANGDIFYENFNTGENFYNFLLDQQNENAAFVPKTSPIKTCLRNT